VRGHEFKPQYHKKRKKYMRVKEIIKTVTPTVEEKNGEGELWEPYTGAPIV
jgi:hypothetical protein